MDKILIFLFEHPKDFISILSMLAVVYLLKAIRDDQKERLKKLETMISENSKELREIKAALIPMQFETKNVVDLERRVGRLDKRVSEIERTYGF